MIISLKQKAEKLNKEGVKKEEKERNILSDTLKSWWLLYYS